MSHNNEFIMHFAAKKSSQCNVCMDLVSHNHDTNVLNHNHFLNNYNYCKCLPQWI